MFFKKLEYLVKYVKKCFLKKLSVWPAFIKVVVWVVNYQKGKCICKVLWKYFLFFYFIKLSKQFFFFIRTFKVSKKIIFFSQILTNNNLSLKIYCENIVIAFLNFNFSFFILFFPYFFTFFSSIFPFFFFFSPLFFLLHTRTVLIIFCFLFHFFPLFPYPDTPEHSTFFFFFLFSFFPFFPYHFFLQNVPLSFFLFLFPFFFHSFPFFPITSRTFPLFFFFFPTTSSRKFQLQ